MSSWFSCTVGILIVCVVLFVWDGIESYHRRSTSGSLASVEGVTSLQQALLFDYPSSLVCLDQFIVQHDIHSIKELKKKPIAVQKQFFEIESTPFWMGAASILVSFFQTGHLPVTGPMFEKIREGQFWRLLSPSFMHKDLLHLLFNMSWLLLLGEQVEKRVKSLRFLFLVFFLGIISNTGQYLMGGPYFLGFSGVITGLVGFIWSRQRTVPEEGYPLQRSIALFVFYFVLVMAFLGGLFLSLQAFSLLDFSFPIANTAHILGGVAGLILGRSNFFSRRVV